MHRQAGEKNSAIFFSLGSAVFGGTSSIISDSFVKSYASYKRRDFYSPPPFFSLLLPVRIGHVKDSRESYINTTTTIVPLSATSPQQTGFNSSLLTTVLHYVLDDRRLWVFHDFQSRRFCHITGCPSLNIWRTLARPPVGSPSCNHTGCLGVDNVRFVNKTFVINRARSESVIVRNVSRRAVDY